MSQEGLLRAKELTTQAQSYLERGWSVIPLVPGLKTPAYEWKNFQIRRATDSDLRHWFNRWVRHGLGVVTGRISSLIVVDFDDPSLLTRFLTLYPHLVDTYIVHTRRGFHLYFQVDPAIMPDSRRVPGVDIQADGCYVVAPPSRVGGHDYERVGQHEPLTLDRVSLDTILSFVDSLKSPAPPEIIFEPPRRMTPAAAAAYYHALLSSQGRNDALFKTALKARDDGQTESWTWNALAEVHANAPAPAGHRFETERQRQREARATIASAFSRPPARPAKPLAASDDTQLSTAIKQQLNQLRLTAVIRLIHALREHGIKPGDTFCYTQAAKIVKSEKIGDWSVRKALHAHVRGPIFEVSENVVSPPAPPVGDNSVANGSRSQYIKPAFYLGPQNQQKAKPRPNHRPPILYRMPGNQELSRQLGIENGSSRVIDPIRSDDLSTAKRTRMACHREFLKRFPQQASGKAHALPFLAKRLGISVQTIVRYNHALDVPVSPNYDETPLHWANLGVLDELNEHSYGCFLVNAMGKKFPPLKQIAANQLHEQTAVSLFRQRANTYHYEALDDTPPGYALPGREKKLPIHPSMRGQPIPQPASPRLYARFIEPAPESQPQGHVNTPLPAPTPHKKCWYCKDCLDIRFGLSEPEKCLRCEHPSWEMLPETTWSDVENFKSWWRKISRQRRRDTRRKNGLALRPPRPNNAPQKRYHHPLRDADCEALAQRVHEMIPDLSLANLREIVASTDADLVRLAMTTLLERRNIRSRAGFFMAFIRSEKKFGQKWVHPKP